MLDPLHLGAGGWRSASGMARLHRSALLVALDLWEGFLWMTMDGGAELAR